MADNAEVISSPDDKTTDEKQTDDVQNKDKPDATADGDSTEPTPEPDSQEVTVTLRDDTGGTQPKEIDVDAIVRSRVNRANRQAQKKVDAIAGNADQAEKELITANQKNQLLELQVQHLKAHPETVKPPDPLDFDDGAQDAKYITALNAFTDNRIATQVNQHLANLAPQSAPIVDRDLESKRESHYRRSVELNAKNYEETEDKAIAIIGQETADLIIKNRPRSTELMWYFGKNPDEAQRIADLAVTNVFNAVAELGALEANLTVKRPAKANQAPEPDIELEGTSLTPSMSAYEKKLDKFRDDVADGKKTMMQLLEFKKANKE